MLMSTKTLAGRAGEVARPESANGIIQPSRGVRAYWRRNLSAAHAYYIYTNVQSAERCCCLVILCTTVTATYCFKYYLLEAERTKR